MTSILRSTGCLASFLIIGGCKERREAGALTSIEEVVVQKSDDCSRPHISTRLVGNLKNPRRSPSVFKFGARIVVAGGCSAEFSHLDSVEIISKKSGESENEWISEVGTEIVTEHSCAAFCKLETSPPSGLVVGGFNGRECLKQVSLISSGNMNVKPLPDFCSRLKNSCAISCENGDVLLIGGWDERQTMKTVFRLKLDPLTGSHAAEMESVLPYQVEGHYCVRRGDWVYIIGGYDGVSVINTISRYNVNTRKCEVLPIGLSIARENHVAAVVHDEFLVVAAGWNGRESLNSVEVFRFLADTPYLEKIEFRGGDEVTLKVARNRPAVVSL